MKTEKSIYESDKIMNEETRNAIDDVNNNRNMSKTFDSVEALMRDLDADEQSSV